MYDHYLARAYVTATLRIVNLLNFYHQSRVLHMIFFFSHDVADSYVVLILAMHTRDLYKFPHKNYKIL
jgi:hypothetical protein